jgi:sugar lactone lactonase YvrE
MHSVGRSLRTASLVAVATIVATSTWSAPALAGPGAIPTPCLATGEIFVSDATAFGNNNGGVLSVDPATGAKSTLTANGNPPGAPVLETPSSMAFEADGDIVLADAWEVIAPTFPGVVRVDPDTGDRTLVSSNSSPVGGPDFVTPHGIAVEASGAIVVADPGAFPQWNGGIIRVDPVTGVRTTLSRNGAPTGGAPFENPWDLVVAPNGDIYVVDLHGPPGAGGDVTKVDPVTGARTVISRNNSPAGGPSFAWPWGIALEADGDILISDFQAFGGTGGIIRVDPVTGVRTTVSENAAPAGGPQFAAPGDLIVEPCGEILVVGSGGNGVLRVDPVTGVRTTVSDDLSPGSPDYAFAFGILARPQLQPGPGGGGSGGGDRRP